MAHFLFVNILLNTMLCFKFKDFKMAIFVLLLNEMIYSGAQGNTLIQNMYRFQIFSSVAGFRN